ncbi:MAG: methanogenesis marker 17 protein [Candidatus Methanomethylophilaceae archaeon]|jgi:putative methanogenesis marker protein 17
MDVTVHGPDPFGNEAYKKLFEDIMSDTGDAVHIEKAELILEPEIPIFVFSIKIRAAPADKTVADVSSIRKEGSGVQITVTDERHAPGILEQLWAAYGRNGVEQQTRFDMYVEGGDAEKISSMVVASGEESLKEIIGSVWRSMPEGIKVRRTFVSDNVVTVVATEEIMTPEILAEGVKLHTAMGGKADV